MADRTIRELDPVRESPIGGLPEVLALYDDTLLPVEQQGAAMRMSGRQFRQFGEKTAELYVNTAVEAAADAEASQRDAEAARDAAKASQAAAAGSAAAASASAANAKKSENVAKESATAAKESEDDVAASAAAAKASEDKAKGHADAAKAAQTAAETARDAAKGSQDAAKSSADAAAQSAAAAEGSKNAAAASAAAASGSATKAAASASNAADSEEAAAASQTAAKASENAAKTSQTEAAKSAAAAAASQTAAAASQTEAKKSETAAASSKDAAATSAANAKSSADSAAASKNAAATSASQAAASATAAAASAKNVEDMSNLAESYAVGGTDTRPNEDADNAKYYYEQAKGISQGLAGSLLPMGTVAFASLKNQTKEPGYMYNISDAFTTDATFKEGTGHPYPAGTNVYYTADGYWDCLAGSAVVSVAGRTGAVTLTKNDVGLNNADNTKDSEKNVKTAKYLSGFDHETSQQVWGNQDGTFVTGMSKNGAEIAWRNNSGQLNQLIDGYYYQGEGKNRVLDTTSKPATAGTADTAKACSGNSATATKLAAGKNISISGGATAAAKSFDGSAAIDLVVTALDVSKANAGTLPIARGGTGAADAAAARTNLGITPGNIGAQAALGFTPVQQGGGAGQNANKIYIGWSGSAIKAQVDATDMGQIYTESQPPNRIVSEGQAIIPSPFLGDIRYPAFHSTSLSAGSNLDYYFDLNNRRFAAHCYGGAFAEMDNVTLFARAWTLLWANSMASDVFPSQAIDLPALANYNLFCIQCCYQRDVYNQHQTNFAFIPDGIMHCVQVGVLGFGIQTARFVARQVYINKANNQITFSDAVREAVDTGSVDNGLCIPAYIFGID